MGRLALSVLLFQDLMVAPVLFITGVLGRGGAISAGARQRAAAGGRGGRRDRRAGRFVLRPLLRFTAKTGSRDLIMAIAIADRHRGRAVRPVAGLSTALGAFLAGLLLGETEYRHQIEVDLEPFKGLLLGLFFVTVGMTIDVRAVWAQPCGSSPWWSRLLVVKASILLGRRPRVRGRRSAPPPSSRCCCRRPANSRSS